MTSKHFYFTGFYILFFLITFKITAQEIVLQDDYEKHEYQIEMRDGVRLFTSVYSPKDTAQPHPIIIYRTPYSVGPYGEDKFPLYGQHTWQHFIDAQYIIVFQDVRGMFMSEGDYVNMTPYVEDKQSDSDIDETTDAYDTVDWLVKNIPNNNGNVGLWGISYPGFYAAMAGIDAHPAVKAISPQAPIADWANNDDWHHNGAFALSAGMPFLGVFGVKRDSLVKTWAKPLHFDSQYGYGFYLNLGPLPNVNNKYFNHKIAFWDSLMAHGTYDNFWKKRNSLPHFNDVKPAVLVVGGWFDAEDLFGALHTYKSIENKNPVNNNTLVMGPWGHGGWVRTSGDSLGDICFDSKTSEFYVKNIELPFFNHYLYETDSLDLPEVYAFETGANEWHKYDAWPPQEAEAFRIYLDEDNSLAFDAPVSTENKFDEYISDPSKPVPYSEDKSLAIPKSYMTEDQRFASTRPDVLVYQTDVLEEDYTFAGDAFADLYVSTTGTDADWVVKLIDVFPADSATSNGVVYSEYQMLVRGNILRGKFRESLEKPIPFEPGKITNIKFDLLDVNHTFQKGHRIMIQIQSSWFPLFDRNPQKFVDIYNANENDFQKAENRVYFSSEYPSRIILKKID